MIDDVLCFPSQKPIPEQPFRRAFEEWNYLQNMIWRDIMGHKDELCAACAQGCCNIHIDGNMKLWNRANAFELHRKVYYAPDVVFAPDAMVKNHEKALDTVVPTLGAVRNQLSCSNKPYIPL
jgi:hypothetical protein